MSNKQRWRYGDTNPVFAAVDLSTVIEIGDMLYLAGDTAKPASLMGDDAALFVKQFLGVATQQSRDCDMTPIRVATTGVFDFDCAASTLELGEFIGVAPNPTGGGLLNQTVEKVATADLAIGRVTRRETIQSNTVLVDIRSTVMTGGVLVR